jgi:integrase
MRGSVYYQSAELIKILFVAGAKKTERIDPTHPHYQKLASFATAKSYRALFENFLLYLREHWLVKDPEKITGDMVASYMDYKVSYHPSKQYLEKISAAIGKLEIALKHYTKDKYGVAKEYDFSVRQFILDESRDLELVADNYHNRAYENPKLLIKSLSEPLHRLAARIQYEGGARLEGVALIKSEQLHGIKCDAITCSDKAIIFTKEKGGKEGDVLITLETYELLQEYIQIHNRFKIDRQKYSTDIRETCKKLGIPAEGSHAFRWNFAKRRMMEYARAGYTYEQSLQAVSWEMKHNRANITEHYLGG